MKTKNLSVRIPQNLHDKIKASSFLSGLTLQDMIIKLITNELKKGK